jgi:hypothetical protein
MDNLSSLFPRNHQNSYSKIDHNRTSFSQRGSNDQEIPFSYNDNQENKTPKMMSTNLSFNQNLEELENKFSEKNRRSKSQENNKTKADMDFENKSDESMIMSSENKSESRSRLDKESLSKKSSQKSLKNEKHVIDFANITKSIPSKNSLLNSLGRETPKNIDSIENVVFSFMGNSKNNQLVEPSNIKFKNPVVNITPTMDQLSDPNLNENPIRNDNLSVEKLSKKNIIKSMSSEFSYGNFSIDAIENKIRDFDNTNPSEDKDNEKIKILERINEEEGENGIIQKYSKSLSGSAIDNSTKKQNQNSHVRYSNKEDSSSSRNQIEKNSFSISNSKNKKINSDPIEPFKIYIDENENEDEGVLNIHSTKSNPQKKEDEMSPKLFSEVDYNYSQSLGNDNLRHLVPENENLNSIKTITQYSIFESKRQLSNSIGGDSSFKESEFEVKIKPNLNNNPLDSPKLNIEPISNEKSSELKIPKKEMKLETPKFSKLEELMKTKEMNEMSFTKHENTKEKDNQEEQFKKTVEDLNMDSITMRTQSLDPQTSLITDLMKSKKSSKEDIDMKSRITEFDIIKNFEKFDPQGSLLKKLIVKYNILTGKID